MKYELPEGHGLSDQVVDSLVYKEDGVPSLTDAQYSALSSGLGAGQSILVVSPTSTGKTQIATWAIANGIETNANTVYLVTHRALAKQKFFDFQDLLITDFFEDDRSKIVIATGDAVRDGNEQNPADPLRATLLVATYEKYLAMLSASGVPASMENTVVVCDEIQLLGDKHRGKNVEILLTLLKHTGWRQFVGLSAVLEEQDSADLANWLNVALVRETAREKELHYEYWSNTGVLRVNTANPEQAQKAEKPAGVPTQTLPVIRYLEAQDPPPLPVIVFCMRKQDLYDLASADLEEREGRRGPQLPLDLGEIPQTAANTFLSRALSQRIAIHSADLTDEERKIVEDGLVENKIDIVYATSTLAAGVNFPLGAAIFQGWRRYDFELRDHRPIDAAEFHNMAGRVGRMGTDHAAGRVIFFPEPSAPHSTHLSYLDLTTLPPIECRLNINSFDQLTLQLIASGLCNDRECVRRLIQDSFSGLREQDRNLESFNTWPATIDEAINQLVAFGMVVEMNDGRLLATPIGKATGNAGLKPVSATTLLNYYIDKAFTLAELQGGPLDPGHLRRFAFLVFAACFSTPEFRPRDGLQPSRFLPWPLGDLLLDASDYADDLIEPNWFVDPLPTTSAFLASAWIDGELLEDQEKMQDSLSAGMLLEMYRNLGWLLQGTSLLLSAASDSRTPDPLKPERLRGRDDILGALRKLPRAITRLSFRISTGLPDEVLWMQSLNGADEPFRLTREEILRLLDRDLARPETVMLGTEEANQVRLEVFERARPAPQVKSNWLRDRCRSWKSGQRAKAKDRHRTRSRGCDQARLIDDYYDSRGDDFEVAFEAILGHLNIEFEKLDDGRARGAPDYLIQLSGSPRLIVELKSRNGGNLVNYNQATEVLAAAEIHGHRDTYCVTLCQPGVDPSVPSSIIACGRLTVVEASDLGEGLLRLCQRRLTQEQLWQWLATPGQALSADLPYYETP